MTGSKAPAHQSRASTRSRQDDSQPDVVDPVLAFMQQLWAIDRGMRAISAQMRSRLGVTGPERLILRLVGHSPGISAGHLARELHRHPSSLTGALDRLSRRGMIRSVTDAEDRRRVILTLTSAGRRIDRLQSGTVETAMRRALGRVPARSLSVASRVLATIFEELTFEMGDQ